MIIIAGDKALWFLNRNLPAKPGPVVAHSGPELQTRRGRSRPGEGEPGLTQSRGISGSYRAFCTQESQSQLSLPGCFSHPMRQRDVSKDGRGCRDPKQGIPLGVAFPITEMSLPQGQPEPVTIDLMALPRAPKPLGSLKSGMAAPQGSVSPKKGLMADSPSWKHQESQRKLHLKASSPFIRGSN